LENPFYAQFFELGSQLVTDINKYLNPEISDAASDVYPCDNPFVKFKVGSFFKKIINAKEDDVYQTFLNVQVRLDSFKEQN
jgi:hypothetical protein